MFNVSTEFRRNLYNDNRNYLLYADVVLADGTKLSLQNAQIWSNGYKIEDAVSGDNSFDIGSVIINKFTLTINNIYDEYSEYDFTGATVTAHIGMEVSTGTEKIRRGVYTVDEATYNGASITLECLDNLQNLDKPYSLSKLTYPATVRTIMQDACSCCGIQMATAAFDNDSFVVDERPDDSSLTFRQVVLWCMQISCKWAKADEWGRLKIGWYDDVAYEGMGGLDGGSFDNGTPSYQSGDNFDGGTFADYNSGDSFDGGTFADQKKYHHIYSTSSTNLCTDDVVITGVRVICEEEQEVTDESGNTSTQKVDVVYQSGTDGYVLTVSGNKLIQNGKGNDVAVYLGQKLIGWRFRPFNLSCLSDPSIEAGDICLISDRKGNTYKSLVTNTTFQPGNYQAVSCGAETPLRNSATRFSEATQVYQELRKNLNRTKTEWEKAMENLSDRLENSGGLYTTIEKQEDGSSVFYMHDKPLMEDSLVVWKMTRDAWGVSTDGGKTWNGGMTVDGEMITKILQTIGLNADWINSGSIVIKDPRNNVMFLADTATGEVRIVADSFTLRGKTIEELSQEANEAILDALAQDIQTQLDGKIETYSQTSDPSTAWTTTAAKQAHTGDLWYSSSTKLTKRWTGTAWSPLTMEDTAAQELAKSKKRVFVSTPSPPYDVGDLWVGNSASDMKRCQTARSSGSYVSSDWIKAVKYTDDSTALSAYYLAEDAMNASKAPINYLTQKAIFDKLTNNGVTQGIYMGTDSKIYINAAYLRSGIIEGIEGRFTTGIVGGFTIGPAKMYGTSSNGKVVAMQKSSVDTGTAFAAGGVNHSNYSDCPFRVRMDGALFSTKGTFNNAIIKNGTIEIPVTSGYADLTIDSSGMRFNGIMVVGEEGGAPGYQTSPIIIKSNIASGGYTDGDIIVSKGGMWKEVASRCRMYGSQMYATKFNTTSDVRYKKEVTDIEEKYELLFNALRPVRYKWKRGDDSDFHMGFIAQEVLAAIEGAGLSKEEFGGYNEDKKIDSEMTEDQDGNQVEAYVESEEVELSLNYIEFIPINTHMIQKNRAEIKKLKLENAVLKQELAGIKTKLDKLVEMIGGEG